MYYFIAVFHHDEGCWSDRYLQSGCIGIEQLFVGFESPRLIGLIMNGKKNLPISTENIVPNIIIQDILCKLNNVQFK